MKYPSQQQKYPAVGLTAWRDLKHLLTLVLQWTRLNPKESLINCQGSVEDDNNHVSQCQRGKGFQSSQESQENLQTTV